MKWQDPPPRDNSNNRQQVPAWVYECRKRPKEWALVMEQIPGWRANQWQQRVSNPNYVVWPFHEVANEIWEATRRTDPDTGLCDLYVRYMERRHDV